VYLTALSVVDPMEPKASWEKVLSAVSEAIKVLQ
jgi:hypothetical protein